MPRPVALHVLQSTPTCPSLAGPENRLCIKCGRWPLGIDQVGVQEAIDKTTAKIAFVGHLTQVDKDFLLKITRKDGYEDSQIAFVPVVMCGSTDPTPTQLRCCRAFVLGTLSRLESCHVVAIGSEGLASLRGKSDLKKVDSALGREMQIADL